MKGEGGVGGVADVPIHSAGAVGLVGGSGPQDGGQIALHQLIDREGNFFALANSNRRAHMQKLHLTQDPSRADFLHNSN